MDIRIDHYPQLRQLCWNRPDDTVLDGRDALAIYERNWRFIDLDAMELEERDLLEKLVTAYGNGRLMVTQ